MRFGPNATGAALWWLLQLSSFMHPCCSFPFASRFGDVSSSTKASLKSLGLGSLCLRANDETSSVDPGSDHMFLQSKAPSHIPVLHESERVLVVEKPHGVSHHNNEDELGILGHIRQLQSLGKISYPGRLYGVHRLDRVTSGIVVLAKDAAMASDLTRVFRDGLVTKYYYGLSARKAKKKQGWVKGNMIRGRRKSWYLAGPKDTSSTDASFAETRFFTAGLGHLTDTNSNLVAKTCLLFRPYTGKTHQLRVAAKSVGLPLLGDPIYKDGTPVLSETRTYLHSAAISVKAGPESFAVWSRPPFSHLWGSDGKGGFEQVVSKLMSKHCDCAEVRCLVERNARLETSRDVRL